jgi:hypothetical protein
MDNVAPTLCRQQLLGGTMAVLQVAVPSALRGASAQQVVACSTALRALQLPLHQAFTSQVVTALGSKSDK